MKKALRSLLCKQLTVNVFCQLFFDAITLHPNATDTFWLIEVSNSTLAYDLNDKKAVYAQEGIQEYWVIDIQNKRLHVFKDLQAGQYHSMIIHTDGIISPHAFPDVKISVKELLS